MTINITELQSKYQDKRTPEGLESYIVDSLSCGMKPIEITKRRVSKTFGYKPRVLTSLLLEKLDHYEPRLSFEFLLKELLEGCYDSSHDKVYREIKKDPGITSEQIAERLGLSRCHVRQQCCERLVSLGLVVPARWYDENTKHNYKRYFLTKYSKLISPEDLKITKAIHNKTQLQCLIALHLFGKLSTLDLSGSLSKTPLEIYDCLRSLVKKDIVEKFGGSPKKYKLSKDSDIAISHILSLFHEISSEKTEDFLDNIRYLVMSHKLAGKRVIIENNFFRNIVKEAKGEDSMENFSIKLGVPLSTFEGYLYAILESVPFEVIDKVYRMQLDFKWKKVEGNIEVKTFKYYGPDWNKKIRNAEAVLRKHGLTEILDKLDEKCLIGQKWELINEELEQLPTFKKLREIKSGSIKDISNSLKRNREKPSLLRMLHELEVLKEFGFIEEKSYIYKINQESD